MLRKIVLHYTSNDEVKMGFFLRSKLIEFTTTELELIFIAIRGGGNVSASSK